MKKWILLLVIISISCKTRIIENSYDPQPTSTKKIKVPPGSTVFYFIRHAEKEDDGTRNPNLSVIGKKRAADYVTFFIDKKLNAIYTTNFKRALQTVTPLAVARDVNVAYYNPNQVDYADFIKRHKGETVLIVGHSTTTPNFVNEIIGSMKYSQMSEDNYSDIFKVVISDGITAEEVLVFEEEMIKINAALFKKEKKSNKKNR